MSTDAQPPVATQPTEQVSGNHEFPVVGIGASAGGINALKQFFAEEEEKPPPDITASVEAEEALKDADRR